MAVAPAPLGRGLGSPQEAGHLPPWSRFPTELALFPSHASGLQTRLKRSWLWKPQPGLPSRRAGRLQPRAPGTGRRPPRGPWQGGGFRRGRAAVPLAPDAASPSGRAGQHAHWAMGETFGGAPSVTREPAAHDPGPRGVSVRRRGARAHELSSRTERTCTVRPARARPATGHPAPSPARSPARVLSAVHPGGRPSACGRSEPPPCRGPPAPPARVFRGVPSVCPRRHPCGSDGSPPSSPQWFF